MRNWWRSRRAARVEDADPACLICRIMAAAPGQTLRVKIALVEATALIECRCPEQSHRALWSHPHSKPGCVGY
jgi:hypothetical protein